MAEGGSAIVGDSSVNDESTTDGTPFPSRQRVPPVPGLLCDAVLCYLYNKMDLIVHDTLIKLTTDFFDGNIIDAAKRVLHQSDAVKALDTQYIRRKTGPNKDRKNVEDILVVLHKCPDGLPTFVIADLSLLPPLDVNNVDFAHLLGEMRAVRAEMATLRESVADLQVNDRHTAEWPPTDVSSAQPTQGYMRPLHVNLPLRQSDTEPFLRTQPKKLYSASVTETRTMPERTANVATGEDGRGKNKEDVRRKQTRRNDDREEDEFTLVQRKKRATRTKTVIGTRGESSVKARTGRYIAVFVSRILPDTTEEEMQEYVQETHNMPSKCTKLQTKYNDYSSFKVEVMSDNVSEVYNPEKWPVGAYIRRFYNGRAN